MFSVPSEDFRIILRGIIFDETKACQSKRCHVKRQPFLPPASSIIVAIVSAVSPAICEDEAAQLSGVCVIITGSRARARARGQGTGQSRKQIGKTQHNITESCSYFIKMASHL